MKLKKLLKKRSVQKAGKNSNNKKGNAYAESKKRIQVHEDEAQRFREAVIDLFFEPSDFEGFPFDLKSSCDKENFKDFTWVHANKNTPVLFGMIEEFLAQVNPIFESHRENVAFNLNKKKESLDSLRQAFINPGDNAFFEDVDYRVTSYSTILEQLKGLRDIVRSAPPISEDEMYGNILAARLVRVDFLFIGLEVRIAGDYGFKSGTI